MECFSDGVSPLAIHALQKWGKIGPTSWPLKSFKKDLGQVKAQHAVTKIPEAEHHPENVVSVIEKALFLACFGNLKGGVRETISSEPIY